MTTPATTERGRGRPRQFDEDAVLDTLIGLFSERGFEGASLADIVDTAGLNKSSLYNAFGSKDDLFKRVLDHYLEQRTAMLDMATDGDGGLDDLHMVLEFVRAEALSEAGQLGCLAINTTAELGGGHPELSKLSLRYRTLLAEHLRRPIERAAGLGEIDPGLVDVYVQTAMSLMMTAALIARGGAAPAEIDHHVDAAHALVDTWRI